MTDYHHPNDRPADDGGQRDGLPPRPEATSDEGEVVVRKRLVWEEVTLTLPVQREALEIVRVYDDGSEEVLETPESAWTPRVENRTGQGEDSIYDESVPPTDEVQVFRTPRQLAEDGQSVAGSTIYLYEERPVISTEIHAFERVDLNEGRSTDINE